MQLAVIPRSTSFPYKSAGIFFIGAFIYYPGHCPIKRSLLVASGQDHHFLSSSHFFGVCPLWCKTISSHCVGVLQFASSSYSSRVLLLHTAEKESYGRNANNNSHESYVDSSILNSLTIYVIDFLVLWADVHHQSKLSITCRLKIRKITIGITILAHSL